MTSHMYCQARHRDSPNGCYEYSDHTGLHRGYEVSSYDSPFYWANESETPAPAPAEPAFTQAEVGILLTCLQPVTAFFPELVKKLEGMK